jgi:hypothetical protein
LRSWVYTDVRHNTKKRSKHLKNIDKLICFGLLTSLCGCLPGMGEWDITLYEQKIEGTSKAIYKYDAWGGRDSNVNGYAVLDTNEVFTIPRITKLPIYQLNGIPTKNIIRAIERESMPYEEEKKLEMTFVPVKNGELKSEGIKIQSKYYQNKGLKEKSRGYYRYQFETFEETRDSLFFYNLNDVVSKEKSHIDSLRIRKGHIIIRQKEDKTINEIEIENLILSSDGKERVISNKSYRLKPKKETKSDQFSNYGIFKEKSTVPNSVYKK